MSKSRKSLLYPDTLPQKRETTLRISETFTSRQGEGVLTGVPSFFIRTSGCNLRCWFCDTPYASWNPEGDRQSVESLIRQSVDARWRNASIDPLADLQNEPQHEVDVRHVVLTGGEPLVASGVIELSHRLGQAGLHVTIETAGTVDVAIECDLLSLSPKLADSKPNAAEHPRWAELHEQRRLPIATMRELIDRAPAHQVKFVVSNERQFNEIDAIIRQLQLEAAAVWIMPEGVTAKQLDDAATWLRPWTNRSGYRYCDRMQIRWYGNRRGT